MAKKVAGNDPTPIIREQYPEMLEAVKAVSKAASNAVNIHKRAVKGNLLDTVKAYVEIRRVSEAISDGVKVINGILAQLKETEIPEGMEKEGVSSLTLDDPSYMCRVGVSVTLRASVRENMKEEAIRWLREGKLEDYIQPTINASSLSALAREMAEENRELPDNIFNVFQQHSTSVTAIKGK